MNAPKAIAILAVPFALATLVFLLGMCLTPYWKCWPQESLELGGIWKPALFILGVTSAVAAVVLWVDYLLISMIPSLQFPIRTFVVALIGAAVGVVPGILVAAFGGQGWGALSPQLEFLPFAMSGAVFEVVLDRLTRPLARS